MSRLVVIANLRSTGFFLTGIAVGTLILALSFFLFYSGRIYPGLSVGHLALGGKTIEQSEEALRAELSSRLPKRLTLTFEGRAWDLDTATIGARLNATKTSTLAFSYGRKGSVIGNLQAIIQASVFGATLVPSIDIDEDILKNRLTTIAQEVDIPVEEPSLTLATNTKRVSINEGRDGRVLRILALEESIQRNLERFSSEPIALPVQEMPVRISAREKAETQRRAELLLDKSLHFAVDGKTIDIHGDELAVLVNFQGSYEPTKIASIAAKLASLVDRTPQDAVFQFEGGKVSVFRPSQDGLVLDQERVTETIAETLHTLEATAASALTAKLPLMTKPPKITTEEVNTLGIKELVGRGISYFRGSIPSRVHNIVLASSHVNGTLVPPGETFSFSTAVGDISQATGYQQAYIIEKGRTVLGDGGGTCQVSTTLFRAILDAGLPVEERHAHAYRVSYYEQGGWQPGFDATVFVPTVDLKFKNDTPGHILVQAIPDIKNWTLVFELYGTKDGRKVSIGKARVWDRQSAPPERFEDDPTLPKGTVKQVDFAAAGAKAAFDYEVIRGDQVVQKRTFYSNFRPWQAVFLRGTKE